MKKACIVSSDFYKNNRLFNLEDTIANRDNSLLPFYLLKEGLRKEEIALSTDDINSIKESDIVIYNDYPENEKVCKDSSFLILYESELIKPKNWKKKNHEKFRKIFTWNDNWVNGKKYIKFYWPNKISSDFNLDLSQKSKLCTVIAGNKLNFDKRELYSERLDAVQWFEENHPEDFDLYGTGWELGVFRSGYSFLLKNKLTGKLLSFIGKIKIFNKIFKKKLSVYGGKVDSKKEILSQYKFSICDENARDISGYITEKIFDCFFAGTIPIYWGAPNIIDFIPENTFIDKRKFKSYEELYDYMKNMQDEEYLLYLKNIQDFLNSPEAKLFSAKNFAETIINEIVSSIKKG